MHNVHFQKFSKILLREGKLADSPPRHIRAMLYLIYEMCEVFVRAPVQIDHTSPALSYSAIIQACTRKQTSDEITLIIPPVPGVLCIHLYI